MTEDPRHRRLAELFGQARQKHRSEWRSYLNSECEDDPALVSEVVELLEFDRGGDDAGPAPSDWQSGAESSGSSRSNDAEFLRSLLEELGHFRRAEKRYSIDAKVGSGGQGVVYRAWDRELQRYLAMKVTIGRAPGDTSDPRSTLDPRTLSRFVNEARLTGQLDHPGIVPVHDLGLDADGHAFFTMRLIKGRTLSEVIDRVTGGDDPEWSLPRAIGAVQRVCEAVAYAHDRHVIHRDLKPANIMIGRFGEVCVMDWGLGRTLGGNSTERTESDTLFGQVSEDPFESVRDGEVLGTPSYMSPEQARAQHDEVDRRTDVYGLGAILYELLTGKRPYADQVGDDANPAKVLLALSAAPPTPAAELAPDAAPELLAIVDHAMAREAANRFADAGALADELRAFLEIRVVRSYRTGPVAELQKWVRRNPAWALVVAASAAALILVGVGLTREQQQASFQEEIRTETVAEGLLAFGHELLLGPVSDSAELDAWFDAADRLRPGLDRAQPAVGESGTAPDDGDLAASSSPRVASLLQTVQANRELAATLVEQLEDARAARAQGATTMRRGRAVAHEIATLPSAIESLESETQRIEQLIEWDRLAGSTPVSRLDFSRREAAVRRDRLHQRRLRELLDPGALYDRLLALRAANARWREFTTDDEWGAASRAIADVDQSPLYGGLVVSAQAGLVPLGQDPDSGLWEFWHAASGERPERGSDGSWSIEPETGIVLILVPGGTYRFGAQYADPANPHYIDPDLPFIPARTPDESPVQTAELAPYFLSKYELTQAQWQRLTGRNPSRFRAGHEYLREGGDHGDPAAAAFPRIDGTHPVEQISFEDAAAALGPVGLTIPTEAQWESAARAGEGGPYWGGQDFSGLLGLVNFADVSGRARRIPQPPGTPEFDDGCDVHSQVDRFPANRMGFHSIVGNVREWCRDWTDMSKYDDNNSLRPAGSELTGERGAGQTLTKAVRGGSFRSDLGDLRLSRRRMTDPSARELDIGVRPSRALDR